MEKKNRIIYVQPKWWRLTALTVYFDLRVKPAIDRLKFSRFSRNWINFDKSMGRLVVLKSIHPSMVSVHPADCFFFSCDSCRQWTLYSAGGEGSLHSPPAEHNSTAGGIPSSKLTTLMGESSNLISFNLWFKKRKLHNLWLAFECLQTQENITLIWKGIYCWVGQWSYWVVTDNSRHLQSVKVRIHQGVKLYLNGHYWLPPR